MENDNRIIVGGSSDDLPNNNNDSNDNNSLVSGSVGTQPKKKRKEIAPRSKVWNHFDKVVENGMCGVKCRNWVLHKRILNFCPISSHKGEQMAEAIGNCLLDWNLDNVFSVTVDNASSKSVMITKLSKQLDMWGTNIMEGKHLHMRCMAPILNLIVQEGLKEIDISVKRVRQMVRWNSTYLMLEVAQNFEKAFDRFDLFDEHFKTYLSTHICEGGSIAGTLGCDEWANVSGSHYVTSSVHFEDICEFDVYLKLCLTSEDLNLKNMADGMIKKFKRYWGTPDKMNSMIYIASVLDPRNKFV
ncbi:zinc finger BED domain-containing protein RICESLEEPER 1-like [Solanum stenotomum]|uniref:zinc finger BED domain-containing protein RICESLEEPER 1-like n=1 Tax=Solanum stenotomum TaxID=172797 RepID=UPI0020D08236|nr:zinc finger BED domain-containing protein RICESLEEPER 1-like [Solanum stenotomum]